MLAGAAALLLLAAVAGGYFLLRTPERAAVPAAEAEAPPTGIAAPVPAPAPEVVAASPAIPAPEPEPAIPLPALEESDAELGAALTESFGAKVAEQYLRPENFVRNLVVTIDNLPRGSLAADRRPIQPTPGLFVARGRDEALYLSDENYSRYTPFVTLLARTDARTFAALYRRYYPLMQEAYAELGNPEPAEFNTRVLEVIDHLLAAPDVDGPVALIRPKVLYELKDPALEQLSSGQKILLRMGPAHAAAVKAKLAEIRAELQASAAG